VTLDSTNPPPEPFDTEVEEELPPFDTDVAVTPPLPPWLELARDPPFPKLPENALEKKSLSQPGGEPPPKLGNPLKPLLEPLLELGDPWKPPNGKLLLPPNGEPDCDTDI
jgi:hypothetical protein